MSSIAHGNIEQAVRDALTISGPFVPVIVGGDHSITAPAVRGFAAANAGKKIGIINIDAHYDVRVRTRVRTTARPSANWSKAELRAARTSSSSASTAS